MDSSLIRIGDDEENKTGDGSLFDITPLVAQTIKGGFIHAANS